MTRRHRAVIGYEAAHMRVRRAKGRASDHDCLCGERAAQWAYLHTDPEPMSQKAGKDAGMLYSGDPAHYGPRCRPCHRQMDREKEEAA